MFYTRMLQGCALALSGLLLSAVVTTSSFAADKPTTATTPTAQPTTGTVIFKVNGQAVTESQLDEAANAMMMRQTQGRMMQGESVSSTETAQLKIAARDQAYKELLGMTLMDQAVEKALPSVKDEAVTAELDKLKKQIEKDGKTFDDFAKQNSMTEAEIKDKLRRNLAAVIVIEKTAGPVEPKEEEMKATYEKYKTQMNTPEQVRASHILIGYPADKPRDPNTKPTDAEKAPLKAKAEEVLKKVKDGGDFAALAKEYSSCPSKAQGGDLGYFEKDKMVKEFSDAAWALKPGETSGIVETQFGFHIIKKTGHKDAKSPTYEEMKDRIRDNMRMMSMRNSLPVAVEALKKDAKIETLVSTESLLTAPAPVPAPAVAPAPAPAPAKPAK